MEATGFASLHEKRVFPKNDVTMNFPKRRRHKGETYLKSCVAVLLMRGCLHWLSSSIHSRIMVIHNFKSHNGGFHGS